MQEAQRRHAERLQRDNPHAEVMEVTHDFKHDPWKVKDLLVVFEDIVRRIFTDFPESADDFVVRKTLLRDPKILEFQRSHPRLYYTLTDRSLMRQEKYRTTLARMLGARSEIESGRVPADERGDAVGMQAIVGSLLPTPPEASTS